MNNPADMSAPACSLKALPAARPALRRSSRLQVASQVPQADSSSRGGGGGGGSAADQRQTHAAASGERANRRAALVALVAGIAAFKVDPAAANENAPRQGEVR